jgi:hypothetical protein
VTTTTSGPAGSSQAHQTRTLMVRLAAAGFAPKLWLGLVPEGVALVKGLLYGQPWDFNLMTPESNLLILGQLQHLPHSGYT